MASTRRVRSSVLTPSAGDRSLLAGTPFSGLAYKVEDNGIVREIRVFEDGAMTGVSDDWVDSGGNARLDRAVLDLAGDYGPLVRGDEPVTGIVYFFDGPGNCVVEEAYADGFPADTARRGWYASGAPEALLQGPEGWAWFEDGRLKARVVDEESVLSLIEQEDGALRGIALVDKTLLDIASVRLMIPADEVLLIGPGIDADILRALREETRLVAAHRLWLTDTSLGPNDLELIASLDGVKDLWLARNASLGPAEAEALRSRRNDWTVHYEAPRGVEE